MRTTTYDHLVETMPHSLDRAIMQVLKRRIGKANAVKKEAILAALRRVGFPCHERQFRQAVHDLRHQGWLIASTSADGYYLVANKIEYEEFRDSEFSARIADLSETRSAMDSAAIQRFGEAVQVGLL